MTSSHLPQKKLALVILSQIAKFPSNCVNENIYSFKTSLLDTSDPEKLFDKGTKTVETVEILKELVKVVAQRGVFWKGGKELINLWYYTIDVLYGLEFTEQMLSHQDSKSALQILEKIKQSIWGVEKTNQGGSKRLDNLDLDLLGTEVLGTIFQISKVN